MQKMHVKKIFKQYMVPFLKEKGFTLFERVINVLVFAHIENSDARIYFSIEEDKISADFSHKGRPASTPLYMLSMFIEEPEFPDPPALDNYWRFDNEDQLIGALEEQMKLLRENAIPWLLGESTVDVDNIVLSSAIERSTRWKNATNGEKKIISDNFKKMFEKWINRRVTSSQQEQSENT